MGGPNPIRTHYIISVLCVPQGSMMAFVDGIEGLPQHAKDSLKKLTPANYIGNAAAQAKDLPNHL